MAEQFAPIRGVTCSDNVTQTWTEICGNAGLRFASFLHAERGIVMRKTRPLVAPRTCRRMADMLSLPLAAS